MGRIVLTLAVLAATTCRPALALDLGLAGARPIAYETIRDASGVLGYAESLLGPEIATGYGAGMGPGASLAEPSAVAGAWELLQTTSLNEFARRLRSQGVIEDVREYRDGSLWIADYRSGEGEPVRLLRIDGNNRAFETKAAPEVRPGPHVYLIAYRKP